MHPFLSNEPRFYGFGQTPRLHHRQPDLIVAWYLCGLNLAFTGLPLRSLASLWLATVRDDPSLHDTLHAISIWSTVGFRRLYLDRYSLAVIDLSFAIHLNYFFFFFFVQPSIWSWTPHELLYLVYSPMIHHHASSSSCNHRSRSQTPHQLLHLVYSHMIHHHGFLKRWENIWSIFTKIQVIYKL